MKMTRTAVVILAVAIVLVCGLSTTIRADDNWFSSGILVASTQTPIAANQVLVDGRHNDQANEFVEEVDVIAAANVAGFVALQRIGADGATVIHAQPVQVGLGASPATHFHIIEEPGEHLRIVNILALTSGGIAVSLLYTN